MKLYDANKGLFGRKPGVYFDEQEARNAEDVRARREGRKPNYETMGGTAGTVYVTAAQLLSQESVNNQPSTFPTSAADKESAVDGLVADDSNNLEVAFEAPDVPEDDGLDSVKRQEKNDKALAAATKKTTKKSVASKDTAFDPTK
jgi:hypothetical protein